MPQFGPIPAEIAVIGDYPDGYGDGSRKPFEILNRLGIVSTSCYFSTLTETQPPEGDIDNWISERKTCPGTGWVNKAGKWFHPTLAAGCAALEARLVEVAPKVVVTLGKAALAWFAGPTAIAKWRGSRLTPPGYPFTLLPTIHPRTLVNQPDQAFILQMDLTRAYNIYTQKQLPRTYDFIIQPNLDQVLDCLADLYSRAEGFRGTEEKLKLSGDLETRAANIACFGIAWSETEAICVPHLIIPPPEIYDCGRLDVNTGEFEYNPRLFKQAEFDEILGHHLWHIQRFSDNQFYWSVDDEAQIIWLYAQLFHHPNVLWVGQNYLYDCQYFWRHWGILPISVRDTMVAHHSLHSNIRKGLDFLSSMYAQDHVYWKDEIKEWDPKIGEQQYWTYNCKDACITWEIDTEIAKERERD